MESDDAVHRLELRLEKLFSILHDRGKVKSASQVVNMRRSFAEELSALEAAASEAGRVEADVEARIGACRQERLAAMRENVALKREIGHLDRHLLLTNEINAGGEERNREVEGKDAQSSSSDLRSLAREVRSLLGVE